MECYEVKWETDTLDSIEGIVSIEVVPIEVPLYVASNNAAINVHEEFPLASRYRNGLKRAQEIGVVTVAIVQSTAAKNAITFQTETRILPPFFFGRFKRRE